MRLIFFSINPLNFAIGPVFFYSNLYLIRILLNVFLEANLIDHVLTLESTVNVPFNRNKVKIKFFDEFYLESVTRQKIFGAEFPGVILFIDFFIFRDLSFTFDVTLTF